LYHTQTTYGSDLQTLKDPEYLQQLHDRIGITPAFRLGGNMHETNWALAPVFSAAKAEKNKAFIHGPKGPCYYYMHFAQGHKSFYNQHHLPSQHFCITLKPHLVVICRLCKTMNN
jgi:hypothetical protein